MAATPKFYSTGAVGSLTLTTSLQTITTGQASDSDIVVLSAVNTNTTTAKTVTLADGSDNTIGTIEIPANAGLAVGNPPIDLMKPGYGMVGLETNPAGGYNFFLPNTATDSGMDVLENTAFVLTTDDAGDATTGDGDIDIVVYYTIETTNN